MNKKKKAYVVKLFMEENDKKALEELYKNTNDLLVKKMLEWHNDFSEFIEEPSSYCGNMYIDIIEYIFEKYKLNKV